MHAQKRTTPKAASAIAPAARQAMKIDAHRKAQRAELLGKRRHGGGGGGSGGGGGASAPLLDAPLLAAIASELRGPPGASRVAALQRLRQALLADGRADPPAREVVDAGLLPLLTAAITGTGGASEEEAVAAASCLASCAAGAHEPTMAVLATAGPHLITLLRAPSPQLVIEAISAVGNIAADSPEARAALLALGAAAPLTALLALRIGNVALARGAAWSVSNMLTRASAQPFIDAGAVSTALQWISVAVSAASASPAPASLTVLLCAAGEMACVLSHLSAREPEIAIAMARSSGVGGGGVLEAAVALFLCPSTPRTAFAHTLRLLHNLLAASPAAGDAVLASVPQLLTELGVAAAAPLDALEGRVAEEEEGGGDEGGDGGGSLEWGEAMPSPHVLGRPRQYTPEHVRGALSVLSTIAGGSFTQARALVDAPHPPSLPSCADAVLRATAAHHGLGLLPLLLHRTQGPYLIRHEALRTLFHISAAHVPAIATPAVGGAPTPPTSPSSSTPPIVFPLLAITLSSPSHIIPPFLAALDAPDTSIVHLALSFVDLVLHRWRCPPRVAAMLPPGACFGVGAGGDAACEAALRTASSPALLAAAGGGGPRESGAALIEAHGGVALLEALATRENEGGGGGGSGSRNADWAEHLMETWYGEDAYEEEEEGGEGPSFSFGLPVPAAGVGETRGLSTLPAWMAAAAAPQPPP